MINIFQPNIGVNEIKNIKQVFDSKWLGKGDFVSKFEFEFSKHLNSNPQNFTTVSNCSEGLFLAGRFFDFNSNDEIIAPSISFHAVGNSIISQKSKMILCDVDRRTLNTTAELIQRKISPKTKAVIITHYGGLPSELEDIVNLCKDSNILLIEDSATCPKSFYKGKAVGTFGDMGLWSFDAMKIITTGDGGMIYLNEAHNMDKLKQQSYLGLRNKTKSGIDSVKDGANRWWEFQIDYPANRSIMNNIAGAMGLAQLESLDHRLNRRKKIYDIYSTELMDVKDLVIPPPIPEYITSSYYMFWIQTAFRDELANFLYNKGIYTTYRYFPLHRIKYFNNFTDELQNSDYVADNTLNIPLHDSLSDSDVDYIIQSVKQYFSRV